MKKSVATTLLLIFVIAHPSDLSSCGPFFSEAVFTRTQVPDNEVEFFEGKLGILHPTLWRAYLAMAYRTLSGMPLSEMEAESVRQRRPTVLGENATNPVKIWLEQRMKVQGAKPLEVEQYRTGADYQSFAGCGDDAFATAANTLKSLLLEPGDEAKNWLAAQDEVFSNCSKKGTIPGPAAPGSSDRAVANRAYQIAAAHFYQDDWDEAMARFQRIAADQSSPWHTIAPYLLARIDLRRDFYPAGAAQLRSILEDPKLTSIHQQAKSLLEYAEAHDHPAGYMAICAKQLTDPHPADLAHSLTDYTFLYNHFKDQANEKSRYRPEDFKELATKDDITSWIENFGTEAAVKRWKQNDSLPWLVSALSYSGPSPDSAALVEAARRVPATSPAYVDVRFQAVRILTEIKHEDAAGAVLEEIAPHVTNFPLSAQNAFRAEHLKLARSLHEFLAYAPRTLVAQTYDDDDPGFAPSTPVPPALSLFDKDATVIFNNDLPLQRWLEVAHNNGLSSILRTEIAQAGFLRSLLLKDRLSTDFARELESLKPSYEHEMEEYLRKPADKQEFEATFWILHHPELNYWIRAGFQRETKDAHIDHFRDNWWCGQDAPVWISGHAKQESNSNTPRPSFLSKSELERAKVEDDRLNKLSGAPAFLSSAVIAWVQTHSDDPRLPEALALAVKSSRFGCTDAGSEKPVSEAFHILHQRFPNSQWAKRTPYWYK